jgi:uncharacterized protein DUF4332
MSRPCGTWLIVLAIIVTSASASPAVAQQEGCGYPDVLRNVGENKAAEAAYVAVLKTDPGSQCAQTGIAALTKDESVADRIVDDPVKWMVGALVVVAGILAVIALFLLVLVCVVGRIPPIRRRLARGPLAPSLQIADFDDGAVGTHMGAGTAALVRALVRPREHRARSNLEIVSGQASLSQSLAPLSELSPQLKAAVSLVSLVEPLLPRHHFVASGVLQPVGSQGAGLTLALQQRGRLASTQSFWSAQYGFGQGLSGHPRGEGPEKNGNEDGGGGPDGSNLARAIYATALPGAKWIEHRVAQEQGDVHPLTADSESFAIFSAATQHHRDGELGAARRLYHAALEVDPHNVGALGNLALIDGRQGNHQDAIDGLTRALGELEKGRRFHDNPDWYRLKYDLAAQEASAGIIGSEESLAKARDTARELVRATVDTLGHRGTRTDDTTRFLRSTVEPSAVSLLAGLYRSPEKLLTVPTGADVPIPAGAERDAWVAQVDREQPDPQVLIDHAYAVNAPTYRAHYNFACFWANTSTQPSDVGVGETFHQLKLAFGGDVSRAQREDLLRWAQRDPALDGFRSHEATGASFEELVERFSKPESTVALGAVHKIGERGASQLAGLGVTSWHELRVLDVEDAEREATDVQRATAEGWVKLAGLFQIDGIGVRYANLLVKAEVPSVQALANADPLTLPTSLREQIAGIVHFPPSDTLVAAWVEQARRLKGAPTPRPADTD